MRSFVDEVFLLLGGVMCVCAGRLGVRAYATDLFGRGCGI